jgi:D-sedoheptulose 7-phosphate isomerase
LLVVISASGNSLNLVRVVQRAKDLGVYTVGMLGFDGGVLKQQVNDCVWIPTEKGQYELVEGAYAVICHILTVCLSRDFVADRFPAPLA